MRKNSKLGGVDFKKRIFHNYCIFYFTVCRCAWCVCGGTHVICKCGGQRTALASVLAFCLTVRPEDWTWAIRLARRAQTPPPSGLHPPPDCYFWHSISIRWGKEVKNLGCLFPFGSSYLGLTFNISGATVHWKLNKDQKINNTGLRACWICGS